jgi:hypothetical protein
VQAISRRFEAPQLYHRCERRELLTIQFHISNSNADAESLAVPLRVDLLAWTS